MPDIQRQAKAKPALPAHQQIERINIRPAPAAARHGIGLTKLWDLVRTDPSFPKPFKLSARCTLFNQAELDGWFADKAAQSKRAA